VREPLWLIALAIVLPAPPVAAQGVAYEGGCAYATGRYGGDSRTTTLTLTSGVAVGFGRSTLRLAWPVHLQRGDVVTTVAGGGVVHGSGRTSGDGDRMHGGGTVTTATADDTDFVLGDPVVRLGWRMVDGLRTQVAVAVAAKAPLAEPEAYGTGEWDVGASASLRREVRWPFALATSVAWWHLGDPPGTDYRDPWIVSLSAERAWGGRGLSIEGAVASPVVAGDDPAASVGVAWMSSSDARAVGLHASVGLTDTASDVFVGAVWRLGRTGR